MNGVAPQLALIPTRHAMQLEAGSTPDLSPTVSITNHKASISESSNGLRQRLLFVLKGKACNGVVGTLGDVILMMTTATSPQLIKADMMDPCGYIYDDSGS